MSYSAKHRRFECDRCGTQARWREARVGPVYYEGWLEVSYRDVGRGEPLFMHLCPDCYNMFDAWMLNPKKKKVA